MGEPKQLLEFNGKTLIQTAVDAALGSVCRPVVVVVGANADAVERAISGDVKIVRNDRWAEGMGTSIARGIEAIEGEVDAVILMLCDQPRISSGILNSVAAKADHGLAAAGYGGTIGVPALFGRQFFGELRALNGSEGAKKILLKNEARVARVACPEAAVDLDTASDLQRLRSATISAAEVPPILELYQTPRRAKWRWGVHVTLLAAYVLGLGLAGALIRPETDKGTTTSAMPTDLRALAIMCLVEGVMFAAVFALAWLFSRVRPAELFLKWRGGLRPILWGFVYSVLLRIAVAIVVLAVAVPIFMTKGTAAVEKLRPKTEAVVNMEAVKNPLYIAFALTVVSFGMAGFREELWRAGMLAGLAGMAPTMFASRRGQYIAVAVAAVIFGLGHLPQGWGGVGVTAVLGLGLGSIIVWHQSAWEAILAHGFFDATTFGALYFLSKFLPDALKQLALFA
jgi:CTP:molybdopterin cytidylyltransferase MocA/membrane protease YdiL (CAAX protease family)